MSPENLIFTFSATAVAELCEALVLCFAGFAGRRKEAVKLTASFF